MVGATQRIVRRWKAVFRWQGTKGLQARPACGRPVRLSRHQRSQLEQLLLKGARAFGYDNNLWTCPRIAEVIRHEYGVRYHVDHIGRLLHSAGGVRSGRNDVLRNVRNRKFVSGLKAHGF